MKSTPWNGNCGGGGFKTKVPSVVGGGGGDEYFLEIRIHTKLKHGLKNCLVHKSAC